MPEITVLLKNVRFLSSVASYDKLPPNQGMEIAFAGRSNAGKSSVLNRLCARKGLAKTSSSPGKTRHINLFALDEKSEYRLADLPGYGYAKVDVKEKQRWGRELTRYILERECLKGLVIVMDMRHPLTDKDLQMLTLAEESGKAIHVLLNKSDKLKSSQRAATMLSVKKKLAELAPDAGCSAFSAVKGDGFTELKAVLSSWINEQ